MTADLLRLRSSLTSTTSLGRYLPSPRSRTRTLMSQLRSARYPCFPSAHSARSDRVALRLPAPDHRVPDRSSSSRSRSCATSADPPPLQPRPRLLAFLTLVDRHHRAGSCLSISLPDNSCGHLRRERQQDFPSAPPAVLDAQGAGAASVSQH